MDPKRDQDIPQSLSVAANPPPQPPTEKRARRRARDVSSRYMIPPSPAPSQSPISSSSSSSSSNSIATHLAASPKFPAHHPLSHLPLPKKPHRRPPTPAASSPDVSDSESEHSSCFANENQPALSNHCRAGGTQRRRALRLFGDNAGEQSLEHPAGVADEKLNARKLRPGTPMAFATDRTGTAGSTPRMASLNQNFQRSMNLAAAAKRRMTAHGSKPELATLARPSMEEDNCKEPSETSEDNSCADLSEVEMSSLGGFCNSPPLQGSKVRQVLETRSSMPEADLLPIMSARRLADGSSGRQDVSKDSLCRASTSLCHGSLNLALNKPVSRYPTMLKPPQPPGIKAGVDSRKGRKAEDVHSLRLLHNQHLQWRFMNAKAQVVASARAFTMENSLHEVSTKISERRDSVARKRIELEELKQSRATSTILEAQMPHLDEWTLVEGDYSSSLSGAIKALQDASLRVPIVGNVKTDVMEIAEVIDSATSILESLSPSVGRFLPEAGGLENVLSDLARVVNSEKAIIEECGDLLSEAHRLQVKECSLRGHLIQLKHSTVV